MLTGPVQLPMFEVELMRKQQLRGRRQAASPVWDWSIFVRAVLTVPPPPAPPPALINALIMMGYTVIPPSAPRSVAVLPPLFVPKGFIPLRNL